MQHVYEFAWFNGRGDVGFLVIEANNEREARQKFEAEHWWKMIHSVKQIA